MANIRRILLAVDASSASRRAVDYVADMIGGKTGFHVGLLHVELPPHMIEWGGSEDPKIEGKVEAQRDMAYRDMEKVRLAEGKTLLQQFQSNLTAPGIDVVAQLVKFDEPLDRKNITQEILTTAKEQNYGTIVVGRHSFSAWQRLFNRHIGEELVRSDGHMAIWVAE